MPIFTIQTTNSENDVPLGNRISVLFADNHYKVGRGQWLILFSGTGKELYEKLLPEAEWPLPRKGLTIFGVAGYYGNASMDMWEWIANRLEATNG